MAGRTIFTELNTIPDWVVSVLPIVEVGVIVRIILE